MAEAVVLAIGGGHFLGHRLARQFGNRGCGGDFHLFVDRGGMDVECAAEDEGEAQYIVDLVRIVRTPGGNDAVRPGGLGLGRGDFGVGVGHREDDRLGGHLLHIFRLQRAGGGQAKEDVGSDQCFLEGARRSVDGVGAFPLVHPFGAATPDHALPVADRDVLVLHTHRFHQRGAGQRRSARAVDHHLDVLQLAPGDVAGIEQPGGRDDCRAVLVVVHDGDLQAFAQRLFDHEAFGGLDVLQVDPAKTGFEQCDRLDEFVGIFGGQFQVDRIDIGKALEQHRLAFHHRLRGQRTQIAKTKDRRAVRDHRHQIALGGIFIGIGRIVGDGPYGYRDARRIGEAEVALGRHRLGGDDLDFTRADGTVVEQRLTLGEPDVAAFLLAFLGQVESPRTVGGNLNKICLSEQGKAWGCAFPNRCPSG